MKRRASWISRQPDQPSRQQALDSIAGVSLELYAELRALMTRAGDDADVHARIARQHGIDRRAWQMATAGWTMRMEDPATAHVVAPRFRSLHRHALARFRADLEAHFAEDSTDP